MKSFSFKVTRKIINSFLFLMLILQASYGYSATGERRGTIEKIQTESSTRVGYENLMYINQSLPWTGTVDCTSQSWAYFNAKDNPHFVATVLTARVTGTPLAIVVDDSLPRINGFCQIINVDF